MQSKKILAVSIFFLQIIVTFVVLFAIYMLLALLDNDDLDLINVAILAIIQPIYASVICFFTILICLVIGLHLRLNNFLNEWWKRRQYLVVVSLIISMIFLFLSFLPVLATNASVFLDGKIIIKKVPNIYLGLSGWF